MWLRLLLGLVLFFTNLTIYAAYRVPVPLELKSPSGDLLVFLNGDQLSGQIKSINRESVIHFIPSAAEKAIELSLESVKKCNFGKTASYQRREGPLVLICNGDHIWADISRLDEDRIYLEPAYIQEVVIPRHILQAIIFATERDRSQLSSASNEDIVILRNGDKISGRVHSIKKSELKIATEYGMMDLRPAVISVLLFGKKTQYRPKRENSEVRLLLRNQDSLTLTVDSLSSTSLKAILYGETVTISRKYLESITPHIYGQGKLDALTFPGDTPAEIKEWIGQLSHQDYSVREAATFSLTKTGYESEPALKIALLSKDAEVRMRSREILEAIHWHIPSELKAKIWSWFRNYRQETPEERCKLIERVMEEVREESIPLFLNILEYDASEEMKEYTHKQMSKFKSPEVAEKIIRLSESRKLSGFWSLKTLARVYESKSEENVNELIRIHKAILNLKEDHIESLLALVPLYFRQKEYLEAIQTLRAKFAQLQGDARFLYLLATAYGYVGEKLKQLELEKMVEKLELDEGTLYRDATYFMENDLLGYSILLWKRILEIPPVDDVYDANAYLRLASIYEEKRAYRQAKLHYQKAINLLRGGKCGCLLGGTIEDLEQKVKNLEICEMIAEVEDFTVTISVKEEQKESEELKNQVKKSHRFTLNVQPDGFRLIEKADINLKYDLVKEQLFIYLNDSLCGKPALLELDKDQTLISLCQLDMSYFYQIDRLTGEVVLLKKFEKNYLIKNDLSPLLKRFKDISITYDKKEYSTEEVQKGITVDWFPEKLVLKLKLTNKEGESINYDLSISRSQLPDQ